MNALGNAIKLLTILGVLALIVQNPQLVTRFTSLITDITKRVFTLGDA